MAIISIKSSICIKNKNTEKGDGLNQERTLNNMAGIREMVMVSAKAFKNSK